MPDAPREETVERVQEYAAGKIGPADLAHYLDASLEGISLYPPDAVLDIGHSTGQILERKPEAAVAAVLQLVSAERRETRAVAAAIVSRLARYSPALWASIVRHLATDADWEVRSFAARAYDSREGYEGAAELHTDWVFEELTAWTRDGNYLLRHAAAEALLGYVQINVGAVPRMLKLLDPLLDDAAEYVRRSHAAALRTMGRKQPQVVLDYIAERVPPASEEVRETLLLVLEHRFADREPERKRELLAKLGA